MCEIIIAIIKSLCVLYKLNSYSIFIVNMFQKKEKKLRAIFLTLIKSKEKSKNVSIFKF